MAQLQITEIYPLNFASGVFRNSTVWARFNTSIDPGTIYGFTVNEASTWIAVDGSGSVHTAPGPVANAEIRFNTVVGFKPYTKYRAYAIGGLNGIRPSNTGVYSDMSDYIWEFTTGGTTTPSGIPEPSGVSEAPPPDISGYMQVVATSPQNRATNINNNLRTIKIEFNHVPASGQDLYDFIEITEKGVLA